MRQDGLTGTWRCLTCGASGEAGYSAGMHPHDVLRFFYASHERTTPECARPMLTMTGFPDITSPSAVDHAL